MSKITLALIVALQVGIAGSAFAAPQKQGSYPAVSTQEQAMIDRNAPAPGGEP